MDDLEIRKRGFSDDGEEINENSGGLKLKKTFKVEYNEDGEVLNLHWEPVIRLGQIEKLQQEGYTHINDEYIIMLTGKEDFPIEDYILEVKDNF